MFRFVFLGVCLFVWINQSSGEIEPIIEVKAGPVTKVFSPPTTTAGETTTTSTRSTTTSTIAPPTPPSTTPYLDKLEIAIEDFFNFVLNSMSEAIAKEQDALDTKVLKVLKSFETQRRALVKGIRNFGFSTILDADRRFAIADGVSGTINCMKSAELALEYLPIGITGDFSFPESGNTFEEDLLKFTTNSIINLSFGVIYQAGETCARLMDLSYAKLNAKFGSSFEKLKKCASNFKSVNVEDIKAFESSAALALQQVDRVVKAVSSCKWSISNGINLCSKNIIRVADATSICDDTSALSPLLANMLTASYNAVTNCMGNAVLSGVGYSAGVALQAEVISRCGYVVPSLSVDQFNQTQCTVGYRNNSDFIKNFLKKHKMIGI